MSRSDLVTLEELRRRVGRPFGFELDGERCIALDLTSETDLYHGLIRRHSPAQKEAILKLVCELASLKRLNLRRNKVEKLPARFRELQNLEWLNLGSNGLGQVPPELQYLSRLKFLHVGNNGFSVIPDFLSGLSHLEYLALHKNMKVRSLDGLAGLVTLRHLNLHYLNLRRLPSFVYTLKRLITLTVWNISEIRDDLAGLKELRFFSNCGCSAWRRLPEVLVNLTSLRMMRLFQNNLEELPEEFGNLEHLEQVSLYQNRLHRLPKSFVRLVKLKKLNLGWNQFKFVPGCLRHCVSLEWLGIFGNPLKHTNHWSALPDATCVLRNWPFTTLPKGNFGNAEILR
jgi:Leucine-rich repeat (LRR) protein